MGQLPNRIFGHGSTDYIGKYLGFGHLEGIGSHHKRTLYWATNQPPGCPDPQLHGGTFSRLEIERFGAWAWWFDVLLARFVFSFGSGQFDQITPNKLGTTPGWTNEGFKKRPCHHGYWVGQQSKIL